MEGKNGYMVIFDEDYQSDPAARKYYRGVMIRQAMKDEQFRGWEEHDLHKAVLDYAGEDSSKSRDEEWWSDFIRKAKDFFAEQDIHFPDKKHFAENTF